MYEVKNSISTSFPKYIYEKEQSQQVSCNMEINASPSLYAHQKAHNQQLYQLSPLAHKELDLSNKSVPISIDESYSFFETKSIGLGGPTLDARRYFSALNGPELETLKVPSLINLVLWCVASITLIIVFTIYALKVAFYFEAVRREFNHPIRINFFFAPWIACMLLALGAPPQIVVSIHSSIWIMFMAPIFALNLKVYGDWLSGGERHLCKVANPCTHLSLLGNFVGALLVATVGYMELAIFFWSIGFVHYLVLLVTLYQRLPSATVLPKELHPIFFLFVALPSSASVSWAKIMGQFDLLAKCIYFLAMFLFLSLVAKSKMFYGLRFNIAWWAYTFPLTISAIATTQYSLEVKHPLTKTLAALLTLTSSIIVFSLAITTMLHTFVWKSMFPNDMAIAITSKGIKAKRRIKEIQEDILPLTNV